MISADPSVLDHLPPAPAPQEAFPEAAAVLREAGWKPHDVWGVYTRGALVMGLQPDGTAFHVKNTAKVDDSPDTPDDPVEAARWLVARFAVAPAAEPEQTPAHEAHSQTGAEDGSESSPETGAPRDSVYSDPVADASVAEPEPALERSAGASEDSEGSIDADFSEPLPELGQELAEEHPEEYGASVAIFGDNLDQKRTAAIGLVMRYARSLMPFWTSDSDIALIELRNYAMGAAEGRWPQDEQRAAELQEMEATLSRMNAIAAARDAKVEFLESATREEVEAFDPEANWP